MCIADSQNDTRCEGAGGPGPCQCLDGWMHAIASVEAYWVLLRANPTQDSSSWLARTRSKTRMTTQRHNRRTSSASRHSCLGCASIRPAPRSSLIPFPRAATDHIVGARLSHF
ncbi:hypothetical protein C8R44DRAFT_118380 [Mycena epipterygia]|nr:hypothetical protein C8R44DRAFT_118380 [Mycena epipterygia]